MGRIYFEISDLVEYLRGYGRVSGIQRVALATIHEIFAIAPPGSIGFISYNPIVGKVGELSASWLEHTGDGDLVLLRKALFVQHHLELRHLRNPRKFMRETMALWLSVLSTRYGKFQALARRVSASSPDLSLLTRPQLQPDDVIISLGTFWGLPLVTDFLRQHHNRGGKVYALIHDLIPLKAPSMVVDHHSEIFRNYLQQLVPLVDKFFANSNATKRDLQSVLEDMAPERPVPIVTVPLAHELPMDHGSNHNSQVRNIVRSATHFPYVLCVGTVEGRKNSWALLTVWAAIIQKMGLKAPRLIFAGKRGWHSTDFSAALEGSGSLNGYVVTIDSPNDAEIGYLFDNCLFSTYPSFYEGWGLPVGESLWHGKTCVVSNTSSLPEVGGDLCVYVDPHSIEDIYAKILDLLLHPQKRIRLEKKIAKAKLRTWADVAKDIYRELKPDLG